MIRRALPILLACCAAASAAELRVFPEAERMAMLKAYHVRMSAARPIPAEGWIAGQDALRRRILGDFGLDPLPPRPPLDFTVGATLERDDCTISRVQFQTFPGFYATAFLYMPKRAAFPAPAVLHPHGHWSNWSADDIVQARCIGLARRGYISLAIQYEHCDDLPSGLTMRGVFLWNNMRGLDALVAMPEVDKTRLGVTGASGGGMQAMDLAALDPRVAAAAVGVYPEYYHRQLYPFLDDREDRCHYAPLGALRYMDEHWILALIAPRPAAVFTVTGDWTAQTIDHELPEVAAVYDLFDAPAGPRLEDVAGPQPYRRLSAGAGRFLAERWEGPHDYTRAMRERMYAWFETWLRGTETPEPLPEGDLALEPAARLAELRGLPPKGRQWSDANLAATWRPLLPAPTPFTRESLRDLLGEDGPATNEWAAVSRAEVEGWDVEAFWYTSEPGVRIPALLVRPENGNGRVTVLAPLNGKNDIFLEPLRSACGAELKAGRAVVALDARMRGEWAWTPAPPGAAPSNTWRNCALVWGRPELGMAACDIRRALDHLAARGGFSLEDVRVVGEGFAALCAAALDERIASCVVNCRHTDLARSGALPRSARHGDIGDIAALAAPRRVALRNVPPHTPMPAASNLVVRRAAEGHDRETPSGLPAAIELAPGQAVEGEPAAVRPLHEARLFLRARNPGGAQVDVHLQRGDRRFHLAAIREEHLDFEERMFSFITPPVLTNLRVALSVPASATGTARVEDVRLVLDRPVAPPAPDGRDLLLVSDFRQTAGIPVGGARTNFYIGYGPGATAHVIPDGRDGRPAARLAHGENYVAMAAPLREPLQRGGLYRFSAVARGTGTVSLSFWHVPPNLAARAERPLADAWETVSLDFFVESPQQAMPTPVLSVIGQADVDSLSLRLVSPDE